MNPRTKAYIYLLTTAVIWGIASPVIKDTLNYITPFAFLFWRFLIVCLILLPLYFYYKKKHHIKMDSKKFSRLFWLGFLGTTFGLSLLFAGYNFTTALDGALIYSVSPVFVVIGGAVFLKEVVTNQEKLGVLIAFFGSIVTIIQPLLEGKALAVQNIWGNFLVFLSALSWAAYALLVRKIEYKDKTDPFILTSIGFFAGFITIIPLFFIEQAQNQGFFLAFNLNPQAIPGLIYMSLISSVIAFYTYNLGYSLIEASEATIFDYLKPVFAAPIAVLWLGEQITLPFLAGAFLIGLGVFLTQKRPAKKA
jgi:drug/metabolite transporter (DMT)-like permease